MIVDIHAHCFPKAYNDTLMRIGGRSLPEAARARRFYYDTVGHGSHAAPLCAWKAFGAERLVAGSDHSVPMAFETYRQRFHYVRECGLAAEDADRILEHNSQTVLGLPH